MTDDQAAKKWCPMSRLENLHSRAKINMGPPESPQYEFLANCIGSKCALWVTHRPTYAPGAKVEPAAPSGQCGLINHPPR